jgi:hypothetical protein
MYCITVNLGGLRMRKYYSYLEDRTFLKEIDTAAFKT